MRTLLVALALLGTSACSMATLSKQSESVVTAFGCDYATYQKNRETLANYPVRVGMPLCDAFPRWTYIARVENTIQTAEINSVILAVGNDYVTVDSYQNADVAKILNKPLRTWVVSSIVSR